MRVLIAAPYVGEIGWELMSWQARVRRCFHHGSFDRLVVIGAAGKEAFYQDMPLDYVVTDLAALPGTAYEDRRYDMKRQAPVDADRIRRAIADTVANVADQWRERASVEILWPGYAGHIWPCTPQHQQFIRYGTSVQPQRERPHVLCVQRQRALASQNNWPAESWDALREALDRAGVDTSVYPCTAAEAIEALNRADLAIGYSTGGLHLASLCGCPHLVWSCDDETRWTPWEITNRQRYQTFWNPLGTPMEYHAVRGHPEPADVAQWALGALERIGRTTGSTLHRCRTQASWHVRSLIAWRVLQPKLLRKCPWRVQQWVRYGLV